MGDDGFHIIDTTDEHSMTDRDLILLKALLDEIKSGHIDIEELKWLTRKTRESRILMPVLFWIGGSLGGVIVWMGLDKFVDLLQRIGSFLWELAKTK